MATCTALRKSSDASFNSFWKDRNEENGKQNAKITPKKMEDENRNT